MAQAAKTITSPIKAAVICPLACSVWPLSPPEVIYLIPPQTSMKKKTKAAMIRIRTIKPLTREPGVTLVKLLKPDGAPILMSWAKTVEMRPNILFLTE